MKTKYKIILGLGLLCSNSDLMPMLRTYYRNKLSKSAQSVMLPFHEHVSKRTSLHVYSKQHQIPLMRFGNDLKTQDRSIVSLKSMDQMRMHASSIDLNSILQVKKDDLDKLILHEIRVDWLPGYRLYNNPERVAITKKVLDAVKCNKLNEIDTSNIIIPEINNRIALIQDPVDIELEEKRQLKQSQVTQLLDLIEDINLSQSNLLLCKNGKIMLKNIQLLYPFPQIRRPVKKEHIYRKEYLSEREIKFAYQIEGLTHLLNNQYEDANFKASLMNANWKNRILFIQNAKKLILDQPVDYLSDN